MSKACDRCGKQNPDIRAVRPRLPGRAGNNGRSHGYSAKAELWCGLCRGNRMGAWKWPPKAK